LEYFGWNSPLPKCLFNLRHRKERMLQFGFHHNILYGHIMRLLGRLHGSFENVGNHQAIYGLVVAVIDLHRTHLAGYAAGGAFDLNFQKRLCIDPEGPHLPRVVEPLWCNTLRSRDRLAYA
jgi:hypothetical protein